MTAQAHVRFQAVSKSYPGVQALKDVSFDVAPGELHAIVGENGAGKSTLIKLLSGAVMPDSGAILVKGAPFSPRDPKDSLKAGISTIYQVFNLLPDQSVARNIFLGKEPAAGGFWLAERRMMEKTSAILETLDAAHVSPAAIVRNLRVGEQQIVEIAKALLNNAELLVMDEPTSTLNRAEVDALFRTIRMLRQKGVTILYISHHLDEVFDLADTVTVMRDGGHIRTAPVSEYTRESMIFDMIGREMSAELAATAPAEDKVVLEVSQLCSGKLLRGVSFSVRAGEILAVAGLSGSGKTELAKALFGEIAADSGSVTLKGKRFHPSPPGAIERGMVYLPEDRKNDSLLSQQNIRRNIVLSILPRISRKLGILNLRQERAVADRQVQSLSIKTAGTGMSVDSLSGGNQQKVALARCLAADPEVLILAEPTQGIDIGVKFELYQFIVDQSRNGMAILLVSSEIAEILRLAHRVMVMREGAVAAILDRREMSQERILGLALGMEPGNGKGGTSS